MLSWLLWAWLFASTSFAQTTLFTRGQKWQIILTGTPDMSKSPLPPTDAPVFDVDLFDNDATTITALKAQGKTVICYFSAGTVEDWRDDAKDFPTNDQGKILPEWPNEKWIRTGSSKVRDVMARRIKMASDKGCDALDPDNIDGYQNDNGLNLQKADAISFMQFLQKNASYYNMNIGLKNSLDILSTVAPIIDFAVNEECAARAECSAYNEFLNSNKPVFHIEYPPKMNPVSDNDKRTACTSAGTTGMSTVMKNKSLDGLTLYCDGSQADTPTKGGTRPPKSTSRPVSGPTTNLTTPSSTPEPPTTKSKPPSSTKTSTQRPPTTTPANPGGGGCQQKHWDQCGGQDWKGCTVCASPYQCKGVSPPYYYQCL
ncbi:uncharacterized protein BDR25DRAFT_381691 [Lindgomyces ingoldianus]|uniref:Uncharacterized protein n=1 Tax=Lindgomyces ingoldianus TaxID=673940 RepID=A0ACB6QAU2_9PLEO|nr:uncharacterized protein BDR25DRAFT_381691 [Lindgomyces ingoldianus]KAF2464068.1 hypothetical protein BDR25DRAFT_381691 [Lindgomyces ingoldianus]